MKFMKLGSKPDQFQTEGDNTRYVATELATDIAVAVGDVKFYLHKFPLLSKSARLQKLVYSTDENNSDEINIDDIPGGAAAFEICAKFCYGMVVTLNAYNVVAARCAAQFLEMYETVEKGNLIYKIDVFLSSSIFRSWKDSIIVLQTTKSLHPWSEELKIVSHCVESIASKASVDASMVEWSYTYNRRKLSSEIENGDDSEWNGVRKQLAVPKDWWVEDLCDLQVDLYKRVLTTIKAKGRVSADVIGEALKAYIFRRLPGFCKGLIPVQGGDLGKYRYLVDTIIWLVPRVKNSVSCSFLLKLLHASITLECGETGRKELMKKIGKQLEEASVSDFLLQASSGETTMYNIDTIHDLVEQFVIQEQNADGEFEELCSGGGISDSSKAKVARLVDGYLAEAARDPSLALSKFIDLAEMVSGFPRQSHDGLYRAIDLYLKEHPDITKSERKKICKLMDCRKLSVEACSHAVQNERLPMRVVVQVLFFEQIRSTSSRGDSTPDLSGSIKALRAGSHGSSRSATTNTEEDWDSVPTAEDLKMLTGEFATLRMKEAAAEGGKKNSLAKLNAGSKGKGLMSRKMLSKLWSSKDRHSENSSSDTSESPASSTAEETKSTPSRSRRHYSS